MSEKRELSSKQKKKLTIVITCVTVIVMVIFLGIGLKNNFFKVDYSARGICEECGYEDKLMKYKNRDGTYMYCRNCYDLNLYLDN
jgi:hypothetical protein